MIKLEGIHKYYGAGEGRVKALENVSLEIERGELVAVIGMSGSGKTTLLNILGCMDEPTEGKYYYDDVDVTELTPHQKDMFRKKHIGFVFQDFALLPQYTVYENIELPLIASNVKRTERKRLITDILRQLGIEDQRDKLITKLSGGQKQRCAIARAIVNGSELLLADEPTGALDTKNGEKIMEIFKELNRAGKTVIIITHDMKVAGACKRVIEIQDGSIKRF
ncbi:MAG: ABC transporter ATP-binding protein [Lachnospiraceae bacterium]|nr:ABC transporter ATP-binding protein [Lachnospiraceae bacterium]